MKINAIFDKVKVYDVKDRLDVVIGQTFVIEILDSTPLDIFTNNDPVLEMGDDLRTVKANKLGESKIRFMSDDEVIKDLVVSVVDSVGLQATSLNVSFGLPEGKDEA
jgi:hypothetical protein